MKDRLLIGLIAGLFGSAVMGVEVGIIIFIIATLSVSSNPYKRDEKE